MLSRLCARAAGGGRASSLAVRARRPALPPSAHTRLCGWNYTGRRRFPTQSFACFSSASTVDDNHEDGEDGEDAALGDRADSGTDGFALRDAIARLKEFDDGSDGVADGAMDAAANAAPDVDNGDYDGNSDGAAACSLEKDGGRSNLLDVMQSSPFASPNKELDAKKEAGGDDALEEGLRAAEDVFGSATDDNTGSTATLLDALRTDTSCAPGNSVDTGTATGSDDGSTGGGEGTPSLAELLATDIYAKSWAGPDLDDGGDSTFSPSERASEHGGCGYASRRPPRRRDDTAGAWSSDTSSFGAPRSWDEEFFAPPSREPSPAQVAYDNLSKKTDELLERLAMEDEASSLQLMDFDDVMTKWSRFHSEVDNANGGDDAPGWNRTDESLKQRASEQCTQLLTALEDNHDRILHHALPSAAWVDGEAVVPRTNHPRLVPNAASYNLALHALAHSGRGEVIAPEAFATLTRMLDRCRRYLGIIEKDDGVEWGKAPPEPSRITYNAVLHAIARSGSNEAGHLAEEAVVAMDEWREECEARRTKNEGAAEGSYFYQGASPNARTLACILDAWAGARTAGEQSFAPERAEAVLEWAIGRRRAYVESVTGKARGSVGTEEADVDFIADGDGVEEEVVDEELAVVDDMPISSDSAEEPHMQELEHEAAPPAARPNTVAFNTCIQAWALSVSNRGREGAVRAQELLTRLEALAESNELDLPPGHPRDSFEDDDADSSDAESSLKPNVRTYSLVMNAWTNVAKLGTGAGESAASHCEEILRRMEERGAIDASVRPNLVTYVTCISAWARARHVEHAASRAEDVLNRMIDLYYGEDATELPALEGDVENASHDAPFNAVITAYARSRDPNAAERALAVLQRLEASPIAPTVTSYNAAIDVCAKHGEPERALEIFDRMTERSIARDSTSYDTVLNAFARADKEGSAERAYDFLCQLEEDHSSGESTFAPSSVSYSTILNAFARASGKDYGGIHTVEKAKEIYDKLLDRIKDGLLYGDADPFANSCFLNCCANLHGTRSEKKKALIMAITAFEEMKKSPDLLGEPNQYTFGTMMKACNRLSSDAPERNRLMESIFAQACKRGCLSRAVLAQFLRNTPSHLNMRVISSLGGTKREIPESWHRNVPRKHWPSPMDDNAGYYR